MGGIGAKQGWKELYTEGTENTEETEKRVARRKERAQPF
jgi:hypothetical protein